MTKKRVIHPPRKITVRGFAEHFSKERADNLIATAFAAFDTVTRNDPTMAVIVTATATGVEVRRAAGDGKGV